MKKFFFFYFALCYSFSFAQTTKEIKQTLAEEKDERISIYQYNYNGTKTNNTQLIPSKKA